MIDNELREKWNSYEHFNSPDDVPSIPIVSAEEYQSFYIPKIIELGGIPKDKLIVGETYIGSCRNAEKAIWNGKQFVYERYKFGMRYDEEINHFEDDNGFDLFVPIRIVEKEK